MPAIVFYVSAHGFGHWAQCAPVIDLLQREYPGIQLWLRSTLPVQEVGKRLSQPLDYQQGQVDVGVIQHSAIEEDMTATRVALKAFHADWEARVVAEADWLARHEIDLVVSDIAPMAFAAAHQAGIRSIALGSLDWFDIYRPFLDADDPAMRHIADAYGRAELLLKLPLSMEMSAFSTQQCIGLIGRRSELSREDAERRLFGCVSHRKTALIMFGGSGAPAFDIQALAMMTEWRFLLPGNHGTTNNWPQNVYALDSGCIPIPDAMCAADVVLCKPGYGTLAEAWLSRTPVCFVPRDGFPEYPFLRDWLLQQAPAVQMPLAAFVQGDWGSFLEQAVQHPRSYPSLTGDGAGEAASIIAAVVQ